MRVRSFEIAGVAETDLRGLHDYLFEVGGFEFRAGGAGFFVVVGEHFKAAEGTSHAQIVMATREADIISVDVVIAGGSDSQQQLNSVQRATELLRGFADRARLEITDI